jgi:hypothetical protein
MGIHSSLIHSFTGEETEISRIRRNHLGKIGLRFGLENKLLTGAHILSKGVWGDP